MWKAKGLFGGRGTVKWRSLSDELPESFEAVLSCELAPSGRVGAHAQEHSDEVVIVTEGQGTAKVDGKPMKLKPQAVVPLRKGQSLELENRSTLHPLRYLIVKAFARP